HSPDLILSFGLESTLYLAMVTAAILAFHARRPTLVGVLLGLATLIRGDAVLPGAILLGAWLLTRRSLPWRWLVAWAVVLLPWTVFGLWYFGSPLPSTLSAKVLQGQSSFWTLHFLSG